MYSRPSPRSWLPLLALVGAGAVTSHAQYKELEADDTPARLETIEHGPARYGQIGILFMTDDIMTLARKVQTAGYQVLSMPVKRPDGTNTQLLMFGPDGERLWITERPRVPTYFRKLTDLSAMPTTPPVAKPAPASAPAAVPPSPVR